MPSFFIHKIFIYFVQFSMLEEILPPDMLDILKLSHNLAYITEIRIRNGFPIIIAEKGRYFALKNRERIIYASASLIDFILARASEYSLYAFHNQVKQGFITCKGGIRIGLAGEAVYEDGKNRTIKNIQSINIRVPHEVRDCSLTAMNFIISERKIKNTLIISPPGCGKTTFLRDISRKLCELSDIINILVIDERFEIASQNDGKRLLNVGEYTDVISGCDKSYGFREGVRTLRPDVIITDELINLSDTVACQNAVASGIKVIASAHAEDLSDLKTKEIFKDMITNRVFERYIILSSNNGPGTVECVYDKDFQHLYIR